MYNLFETLLCVCAISSIVAGKSLTQSSDDGSRDSTDVRKRDYGMLRYGRGLQMLRLGKRSASLDSNFESDTPMLRKGRSVDDQDSSRLSSSDIQAAIDSLLDQPRDETRRQPPLPRYGRDSNSNSARFLADTFLDDSSIYPSDLYSLSNARFFFRPAPRGGRYKREYPAGRHAYSDYYLQNGDDRTGSLTLPNAGQFGQFIQQITRLQPKAVPRPRIGRYQSDKSVDSSQIQSA